MKKIHLIKIALLTILVLLCTSAFANNGKRQKLDSLKQAYELAQDDITKVKNLRALTKEGVGYLSNDSVIGYCSILFQMAGKMGNKAMQAKALRTKGIAMYYEGRYVDALTVLDSSANFFPDTMKAGIAAVYSNMGAVYQVQGDYEQSLEYSLKALKIAEEIGDSLRIITVLVNIGASYNDRNVLHEEALEYSKKAYQMTFEMQESTSILDARATSAINIAEVYQSQANSDSALPYYESALNSMRDPDGKAFVEVCIAKSLIAIGQDRQAEKHLNDALAITKEHNLPFNQSFTLQVLGDHARRQGDLDKAITYYKSALNTASLINARLKMKDALAGLEKVYAMQNQFDSAYKYQNSLAIIKMDIYNTKTETQLSNQLFSFEIDKKQKEIDLQSKDLLLKEASLKRQKFIQLTLAIGLILGVLFAGIFFFQRNKITKEKDRSESLLLNILPAEVAEELKANGETVAKHFDEATILFTDFKGFTQASEKLSAQDLVSELNICFKAFDRIMDKHKIEKIKTIGDAYMAASGINTDVINELECAKSMVLAALEMQQFIGSRKATMDLAGKPAFEMRVGIHTGPVVAGIVGVKKFQYDIWGDTVNTASRMESSGAVGQVNVSQATYEVLKSESQFTFERRGKIEAKGKGEIEMYFVSMA